jgi:hypothetical protein
VFNVAQQKRFEMGTQDTSIQSKRWKTTEEKRRKREKLNGNHQHRAGLHAQKASCSSSTAADIIQRKIDQLSKGVHA